jgi:tripartite-type tricarboxylate transporter receptor subunit TctC
MKVHIGRARLLAPLLLALLAMPEPSRAAEEAPAGDSRITLLIGTAPGGTFDTSGRLVARHMAKYLPGHPAIVPQNMPGANSVLAANHLASVAPQDGSVIAVLVPTILFNQLFKQGTVAFDVAKLQWIGTPSDSPTVLAVWSGTPYRSWQDAKSKPLVLGAPAVTAPDALVPNLINRLLGTSFKIVTGYQGGKDIELAMERGEIDGRAGQSWAGWAAVNPGWVREKKIIPLLQIGLKPAVDLPGVPSLIDLVEGEARQIVELYAGTMAMDRPLVVGPGVPKERTALLRAAFEQTMRDADFRAEAEKTGLLVKPLLGEELQSIATRLTALPAPVIERAAQLMKAD